jgi:hypothetical protein
VIGALPVQLPFVALRVWPCCGVPVIVGWPVLTAPLPCTDEVWLLVALWLPAAFVAVTTTRMVEAGEVTSSFCTR